MNAIIDPHVVSSLRDALDILDAAERVLVETIEGSVLDNRTEVAADDALPACDLVQVLDGVAVAAVAGSGAGGA